MRHIRPLVTSVAAVFGLVACGSSTKVTLELTDAPPDTAAIEHVFVSLERVEVHVAGSDASEDEQGKSEDASDAGDEADSGGSSGADDGPGGWRTVAAKAGTFDLVGLQNDVRATLGELDLPNGKITQIRLFIDGAGKNEVVLTTGATCALDLSNVPPTGIKINHPFKALDVAGSSKLTLVVDFDLSESLEQADACAFTLKPVIKLKSVERD
jgi:hypothetical protein